jgi:hypothetical protein
MIGENTDRYGKLPYISQLILSKDIIMGTLTEVAKIEI